MQQYGLIRVGHFLDSMSFLHFRTPLCKIVSQDEHIRVKYDFGRPFADTRASYVQ